MESNEMAAKRAFKASTGRLSVVFVDTSTQPKHFYWRLQIRSAGRKAFQTGSHANLRQRAKFYWKLVDGKTLLDWKGCLR